MVYTDTHQMEEQTQDRSTARDVTNRATETVRRHPTAIAGTVLAVILLAIAAIGLLRKRR